MAKNRNAQDIHERLATVKSGEKKDWVVVARGTKDDFARGKIGDYEIDADPDCTSRCTGKH